MLRAALLTRRKMALQLLPPLWLQLAVQERGERVALPLPINVEFLKLTARHRSFRMLVTLPLRRLTIVGAEKFRLLSEYRAQMAACP